MIRQVLSFFLHNFGIYDHAFIVISIELETVHHMLRCDGEYSGASVSSQQ